ncbi:MAG: CotH kinase family protein [Rhodospirillales bacterium]|nr:CotH kinase family protein [Rhodospirillales bacterium]
MIIKTPKPRLSLLLGFLVLAVVLVLSLDKETIKEEAYATLDTIIAQDWGFASLTGLYGVSELGELGEGRGGTALGLIKSFPEMILVRVPRIVLSKLSGFPDRQPLERIDIDVKFQDYQTILEDREKALENRVLVDPREVNAKIRYKGKTYKARIRLKGDLYDHWRSKMRMSLRVSLKGDHTVLGFKRFSLHKPGSRQYPYDQVFQRFVRETGVITTRHNYIRVFVNGKSWGVMNIEEHMSKELLEKQQAKESIIFKFGDEQIWHHDRITSEPYPGYRLSDKYLFPSIYQENKYMERSISRRHFSYVAEKFSSGKILDVLDTDYYTRAAIAATVWNNFHTLSNGNTRHYFNPYTLKLEPITTDQGNFAEIDGDQNPILSMYDSPSTWIFALATASPVGQGRFNLNKDVVLAAAEDIPDIYDYYHGFFPNNAETDLTPLMHNVEKVRALAQAVDMPEEAGETLSQGAPTPEQVKHFFDHVLVRHYDDGRLKLFNLLDVPVALETIMYDGVPMDIAFPSVIPPSSDNNGVLEIKTDKTGVQDARFTVETSYGGYKRRTKNNYTFMTDLYNPLDHGNEKFPAFVQKKKQGYFIGAGKWHVKTPLVFDRPLTIEAGATLSFDNDAYFIIKGALHAQGEDGKPITFEPATDSWKGIYVLEAKEPSVLQYVTIKDTEALVDGMLSLTGAVNFYKSPVLVDHVHFDGTQAEDALNVVKSEFTIQNALFSSSRSDAFDSDFSKGKIMSTRYENIGGDAVDFSGSLVYIKGLETENVHDKAVSAGEESQLTVEDSVLTKVGAGIVSKDGSRVIARNIEVSDYALYAVMSYVKKDMFGPSELAVSGLEQNGQTPSLRQNGTTLYLEGQPVPEQDVNIEQLYSSEVMKK